jgi:hypothetical protein|tara:strand:+ start:1818 stop:2012 length:195 start_codon:yes stop_codon:yes gene_type:complete
MYKNFEKANYHNFRSEIAHDSVRVLFLQITNIHKLVPLTIMNWCAEVWSPLHPKLNGTYENNQT